MPPDVHAGTLGSRRASCGAFRVTVESFEPSSKIPTLACDNSAQLQRGTYFLIGAFLSCGRELSSSKIMFLAGGNRVGLAGLKDGVSGMGVGLVRSGQLQPAGREDR